jgi:hypothetical protein
MRNCLLIAVAEAKAAAKGLDTLGAKMKAAMDATRNHWLITDEEERFQAAIHGLAAAVDEATVERIRVELDGLQQLQAGQMPVIDEDFEPIGLLKAWRDG